MKGARMKEDDWPPLTPQRKRGGIDAIRRCGRGAVIVLAAVAISACAGGPQRVPAAGSGAVPWIADPGRAMAQPAAAPAARPCRAADLQVTVGGAGAYQGHATQEIRLTNGAGDACFLPGVPSSTLLFDDGSQESTDPGRFATSRADVQPGQSVEVLLGTPGTCAGAGPARSRVATRLRLQPAAGGSVDVPGIQLDVQCGPSSVVLFEVGDAPAPAGVPQSALTASISAPQAAVRGQVLLYTLTLVNPTDQAIPLSPCPSYSQSLSQPSTGGIRGVHGTWLLNCVSGAVPARGSVAFEMRLEVPAAMSAGPAKLYWDLEVASGAAAGMGIAVQ